MKKYLSNIIFFISFCFIVLTPIELFLRSHKILLGDQALYESINYFENKANCIEILFLGDSRIYYGIDPSSIESGFKIHNFGFAAEPIQTTYWKMKYYIDHKKINKLKTAFIIFDKRMLIDEQRDKLQLRHDYSKYYKYYHREIVTGMNLIDKAHFWLITNFNIVRLQPSFRIIVSKKIRAFFKDISYNENSRFETVEKTGFSRREYEYTQNEFDKNKMQSIKLMNNLANYRTDPTIIGYYHKFVDLLLNNNISVYFVQLPELSTLYSKDVEIIGHNLEIINNSTSNIIQNEFPTIRYVNLISKDIEIKIDDFSDKGHLNYKGAKKIGRIIEKKISDQEFKF